MSVASRVDKASKPYWDSRWAEYKPKAVTSVLFEDIFHAYLPHNPALRCLEIGCVPGEFLCYLHKQFGYQVCGVDYSDQLDLVPRLFEVNGVKGYELYKADFQAWQPSDQYDVVVSFGFVEHFTNYEEVIRKHAALVAPGGWLVITMPNYRYAQHLLHWSCDRAGLNRHNLAVMDPRMLRRVLIQAGMTILRLGYYGTFDFWMEPDRRSPLQAWIAKQVIHFASEVRYIVRHRRIDVTTSWFSPYIVSVARKPLYVGNARVAAGS